MLTPAGRITEIYRLESRIKHDLIDNLYTHNQNQKHKFRIALNNLIINSTSDSLRCLLQNLDPIGRDEAQYQQFISLGNQLIQHVQERDAFMGYQSLIIEISYQ